MQERRMRRRVLSWSLPALFFLGSFALPEARAEQGGMIRGTITNGTAGGTKVPDVEVALSRYSDRQEELGKAKTNKEGLYVFSGIDTEKKNLYSVKVTYKGVEYLTPEVGFDGKKELFLDLKVYETTDKDTDIYVKMHHILTKIEEGKLWIQEVMDLENRGNRVYVGGREIEPEKKEVIRIALPRNALDLELSKNLMSCCIVKTEEGFVDTMDIKPGVKEIVFSYRIDYGPSTYKLSKPVYTKTELVNFFVPEKEIGAKSNVLQLNGPVGEKGQRFLHFAGKNLTPGSQIVVELSGLPQTGRLVKYGIVTLVFLTLAGGFAYPFLRRRRRAPEVEEEEVGSTLLEQRQEALQEIAQLDHSFQSREIDPDEYRSRRKEVVTRAVMITREMKGLSAEKEGEGVSP
jgi:hypothetical protein